MTCYYPLNLYKLDNGQVVGYGPKAAGGRPFSAPCGRCFGCDMERTKLWAIRCRHEAQFWDFNSFVTLTYDDAHLPWHGSLDPVHLRNFLKRLRRCKSGEQAAPGSDHRPIRFFGCGEYGTNTQRPHYHVLLFNCRFEDARKYGKDTFTSELLSSLWSYGSHVIGSVEPASIAYTAGYAAKKVHARRDREAYYGVTDLSTGEYVERVPEFSRMSNRPAIGQYWYDRFKSDLQHGYLVVDGGKVPVPRFYADKFKAEFPESADDLEYQRYLVRLASDPNERSEQRLIVKELVARGRKRLLRRSSLLEG